jgi:hypothetical protein
MVGWVRRVEATYGQHGWHLHVHGLLTYTDGGKLDQLREAIWAGWLRRLTAHGFDAVEERGISLAELDLEHAREQISGYLNKSTYERSTASAARELAGQIGKVGRNGNRAPFDVLADFVNDGQSEDLAIWSEWEDASKGRRALTWSRGLRRQLLSRRERSDEEIAADNDGDQVEVAEIGPRLWAEIVDRRLEVGLLEAVEEARRGEGYEAAAAFLNERGLGAPLRPTRRE